MPSSCTVNILTNSLKPGIPTLTETRKSVTKQSGSVTFSIERVGGTFGELLFYWKTIDNSAIGGTDFQAVAASTLKWSVSHFSYILSFQNFFINVKKIS